MRVAEDHEVVWRAWGSRESVSKRRVRIPTPRQNSSTFSTRPSNFFFFFFSAVSTLYTPEKEFRHRKSRILALTRGTFPLSHPPAHMWKYTSHDYY